MQTQFIDKTNGIDINTFLIDAQKDYIANELLKAEEYNKNHPALYTMDEIKEKLRNKHGLQI